MNSAIFGGSGGSVFGSGSFHRSGGSFQLPWKLYFHAMDSIETIAEVSAEAVDIFLESGGFHGSYRGS